MAWPFNHQPINSQPVHSATYNPFICQLTTRSLASSTARSFVNLSNFAHKKRGYIFLQSAPKQAFFCSFSACPPPSKPSFPFFFGPKATFSAAESSPFEAAKAHGCLAKAMLLSFKSIAFTNYAIRFRIQKIDKLLIINEQRKPQNPAVFQGQTLSFSEKPHFLSPICQKTLLLLTPINH